MSTSLLLPLVEHATGLLAAHITAPMLAWFSTAESFAPLLSSTVSGADAPASGVWLEWARGLNWIDAVLLLGLVAGLLVGIGVGFYRQIAIFFALVVGMVAAGRLAAPLADTPAFGPVIEALGPEGGRVAAFATVLWGALVLGLLACLVFHSFFSKSLKFVDGLLGGAMGVAISSLLFGVLILGVFHSEMTKLDDPIRESRLGSQLAEGARYVARIFPEDIQDRLDRALGS